MRERSEFCEVGQHDACKGKHAAKCRCVCHAWNKAEAFEAREAERKQRANWNAVADGFSPPYPSEY